MNEPRRTNYARLFAEAVQESIIDNFPRETIKPGYFLIRSHRKTKPGEFLPLMPARIYLRDHEPGNESNKLDRWPMPVLAGEILGDYCDPVLVWTGRDRQPLKPRQGYTQEEWYNFSVADARWAAEYAPHEPIARPRQPAKLTAIPPIEPPLGES